MKLVDHIRTVPDFPKKGIIFRDISPLLADPDALRHAIGEMQNAWEGKGVSRIAGFDARGFIFGCLLAERMNLPFVMLRKKGKLPGKTVSVSYGLEYGVDELEISADGIVPGEHVLLVDDLLATGGTARAGATLVEKCDGIVSGFAFVIELSELDGRKLLSEYPISTLITYGA